MHDSGGGGGGYSGYYIYEMVYPNSQYSSAMSTRGEGAQEAANGHDDAAVELAGIVGSLDDSWRGAAADGAAGELKLLQQTSADAATSNLSPAATSMDYQSETHEWARHTLEPMESQPEEANLVERIFRPGSQEQNNAEWQAKNTYNIEVYGKYSDATTANSDRLSKEFPKIEKSDWKDFGEKSGNDIGDAGNPGITSPSGSYGGSGGGSSSSGSGGGSTTPSLSPPSSDGGGNNNPSDGRRTLPDGTKVLPDGTKILPDGTRVLPDGTRVLPDGTRILPDGTRVLPDGTRIKPDGTKILPDGTIVRPNGQIVPPGNTSAAGLSTGSGSDGAPVGMFGGGGGAAGGGGGAASGFGPGGPGGAAGGGAFGPGGGSGGSGGAGGMAAKGGMGAGGMGRGGMGGMMGGGGAGGRGGSSGDDEKEHQDQYFIKQELDPGLHVEYDEFGDKLIDDSTGLTVVPPVIGE